MRSMTGFGTATREGPAGSFACELRSVNHRHVKVTLRVPPSLGALEADLEARVRDGVSRGAILGTIRTGAPAKGAGPLVDLDLARRYAGDLADLGTQLGFPDPPDLALVARLPGVVLTGPAGDGDPEAARPTAEEAVDAALAALAASREKEGKAL